MKYCVQILSRRKLLYFKVLGCVVLCEKEGY